MRWARARQDPSQGTEGAWRRRAGERWAANALSPHWSGALSSAEGACRLCSSAGSAMGGCTSRLWWGMRRDVPDTPRICFPPSRGWLCAAGPPRCAQPPQRAPLKIQARAAGQLSLEPRAARRIPSARGWHAALRRSNSMLGRPARQSRGRSGEAQRLHLRGERAAPCCRPRVAGAPRGGGAPSPAALRGWVKLQGIEFCRPDAGCFRKLEPDVGRAETQERSAPRVLPSTAGRLSSSPNSPSEAHPGFGAARVSTPRDAAPASSP